MGLFSRKKKDKLGAAAHIKPSTMGSSNELSFSVLHAAKNEMDERHGEAKRDDELGKIKLFTGEQEVGYDIVGSSGEGVDGNSSTPTKSLLSAESRGEAPVAIGAAPMPEGGDFELKVAHRKAIRKKRKGIIGAITAAVVVVLVVSIIVGIGMFKQRENDFYVLMDQTIMQVSKTDDTVVQVNEILANPSSKEARSNIETALSGIAEAQKTLDDASSMPGELQERAMLSDEKEAVSQLSSSIEGRKRLLASGKALLEKISAAQKQLDALDSAWSRVSEADGCAREAAALVESPTEENLKTAEAKINQAISLVESASASIKEEQAAQPALDFSARVSYLETQKLVYSEQIQAIESILASDTDAARTHQAAYESADKKARGLAESLGYVGQPVLDAYSKSAETEIDDYESARDQVAAADEYLRKFWDSKSNSV